MFARSVIRAVRYASTSTKPAVLVVGGCGALGDAVVHELRATHRVINADRKASAAADVNVQLTGAAFGADVEAVDKVLARQGGKLAGVVCTAGGWTGGNAAAASPDFIAGWEFMLQACLQPALLSAHVAGRHLADHGTLVVTGAAAAEDATPTMLLYGAAKAATHHLVRSLGCTGSGLPPGGRVLGVLPRTIDTPANRQYMTYSPDWTPPAHIAKAVGAWIARADGAAGTVCAVGGAPLPVDYALASGSLLVAYTQGGATTRWQLV